MVLDTNHNTDVIDGKYLAASTPTTHLTDGLGQVVDMPLSGSPTTTTPRSSLHPAVEPVLIRNSATPTTNLSTSLAADVNHSVSLDTVSHYVTKDPFAMEDDLGPDRRCAYASTWSWNGETMVGAMLSLLLFGDHQANAPPKPPWSFLVQEQIRGMAMRSPPSPMSPRLGGARVGVQCYRVHCR